MDLRGGRLHPREIHRRRPGPHRGLQAHRRHPDPRGRRRRAGRAHRPLRRPAPLGQRPGQRRRWCGCRPPPWACTRSPRKRTPCCCRWRRWTLPMIKRPAGGLQRPRHSRGRGQALPLRHLTARRKAAGAAAKHPCGHVGYFSQKGLNLSVSHSFASSPNRGAFGKERNYIRFRSTFMKNKLIALAVRPCPRLLAWQAAASPPRIPWAPSAMCDIHLRPLPAGPVRRLPESRRPRFLRAGCRRCERLPQSHHHPRWAAARRRHRPRLRRPGDAEKPRDLRRRGDPLCRAGRRADPKRRPSRPTAMPPS